MSSVGYGLLRAVIHNRVSFSYLNEIGVDREHFINDEVNAYDFIKDHIIEFGYYPHLETIGVEIGNTECWRGLTDEQPDFWANRVKERKRFADIRATQRLINEQLESGNIRDAITVMGSSYTSLRESYEENRMADLKDAEGEALARHNLIQDSGELPGIPFGFPFIDSVSGGAQGGDSIAIAGVTGVGKTYLALRIALSAYQLGNSILFLSTEMPKLQTARRLLAMEGHFSTTDLKLGRLSYFGVKRAEEIIAMAGPTDGCYFKLLPGGLFANVEDVLVVTREIRPAMLIIDGAYLLRLAEPGRQVYWERILKVASKIKNLAMTEDIPVLATYQYGKKDVGETKGIGGGIAVGQLAGMVFSFEFERKEDQQNPAPVQYRILKLIKGRDGESGVLRVLYNMKRTSITQDRVISGFGDIGVDTDYERFEEDDSAYGEI